MNVMYSVTLRQMRKQKRRTVITILGVIVAVAMIAAVSSFAGTFMDLFQRLEISAAGGWHASISNTNAQDRQMLAQEKDIQDVFLWSSHGCWELKQPAGKYHQVDIQALDETGLSVMQVLLEEGAYPEKERELLIPTEFAAATGAKPGDILPMTLDGQSVDYTVCGVASMVPFQGYLMDTTAALAYQTEADKNQTEADAYLVFKHPDGGIYDRLDALCYQIPGQQNWDDHGSLLAYMGLSKYDAISSAIYSAEALVMVLILAAAVSLIYNAFAISVTDRAAQFGMLASIGATMRQRRKSVLFEALVIALIAIPFGLVFGYLGIGITFSVVDKLIQDMFFAGQGSAPLRLVVKPDAVALSVVLALVTVLLSAWVPAKRAARVTPMEAIRKTQDIRLSGKQVKTSRLNRWLFGFEGELAAKNLKRSKRRYRVTTVSLATSLVLFLSAYSFTQYMTASLNNSTQAINYDLSLTVFPVEDQPEDVFHYETLNRVMQEALEVPAEKATVLTNFHPGGNLADEHTAVYTAQLREVFGIAGLPVVLIALDDASLADYARQVGAKAETLHDAHNPAAILINTGRMIDTRTGRAQSLTCLDVKAGETLTVATDQTQRAITLAAVTGERPWVLGEMMSKPLVTLVFSTETAQALFPFASPRMETRYVSSDVERTEKALTQIRDAYTMLRQSQTESHENGEYLMVTLYNFATEARVNRQLMTIINIFVFGFVGLLSLVGAANIVGTISTSLMLRKREFAMVKSVGMGPQAFDRMIRCESAFYGLKAVVWGLAASLAFIFLIWRYVGSIFAVPFALPWVQMLIGVSAIFLLVAATMSYSVRKIRKDTIVEDLRLE